MNLKRRRIFDALVLLFLAMTFAACSNDDDDNNKTTDPTDQEYVETVLNKMSLREKVGQMFWIRPEYLLEDVASGKLTPTTKEWPSFNVTSVTAEMKN